MNSILNAIEKFRSNDTKIQYLEARLDKLKKEQETIKKEVLPSAFNILNITEFNVPTGEYLVLEHIIKPNLEKKNEATGFKWLRDNKMGEVITYDFSVKVKASEKHNIDALIDFCEKKHIKFDSKETAHWKALMKIINDNWDKIMDSIDRNLFGIMEYDEVSITKKVTKTIRG